MTSAVMDLDFLMEAPEETGGEPAPVETRKSDSAKEEGDDGASHQAALDDIVSVLMPSDEEEPKRVTKSEPDEKEKAEDDKAASQPIIHDAQLLRLAASWGIGPDQAAKYTDDEALLGAVALREIRTRNSEAAQATKKKPGKEFEPVDDLALPEIKLDEDTDPSIKTAVTSLVEYTKKIKAWAEEKISAQEETIAELRSGQEQSASREARDTEAKIAQLFDEKVMSWGDEFKQLFGVPTQTWSKPGTSEHAELRKLHGYVRQRAAGYEVLSGESVKVSDLAGFLEEARYALWPDRIKQSVRTDISKGLQKQRGGVGLRPGKARSVEPVEQGDVAAKAAIGDFMAEHGLDPWARRKAS